MVHEVKMATPRHIENLADCYFYHTIELPALGVQHGHWDLRGRFDDYVGGVEVKGKSVLDIGTATGFLSFESERLGASRVVSFDMSDVRQQAFLPFKDNLYSRDRERFVQEYGAEIDQWKNAYWLCHRLLNSKAEVFYGNVYDLPSELGEFDVAIVGSVLEHLNDPITALSSIARLTKETIVVVTPLLETEEPIAEFKGRANHPESDFTWWHYSIGVYREVFGMLGFSVRRITTAEYLYDWDDRMERRSTIVAVRD